MNKKKIVVVLSGGMDSSVLLHYLAGKGHEVRAFSVDYGQRHRIELSHAAEQANLLNVPHCIARLDTLAEVLPGSSQTDPKVAVPHGHYEEASMKATVVPNRNMILMAVAVGHAIAHDFDHIAYAAHAGDHAVYPDCRPKFADVMANAIALCHYYPVRLMRPFITDTKADIVRLGYSLGMDFSKTYSCYEGKEVHCGRCGTCVERIGAFVEAEVPDPTVYADRDFALKTLAAGR